MTETEIRELEKEVGRILGYRWWKCSFPTTHFDVFAFKTAARISQWRDAESRIKEVAESDVPGGAIDGSQGVPRFARDPDAILSALEWLTRSDIEKTDIRYDSHQIVVCSYADKAEVLFDYGYRYDPWVFTGETLGIAICRAIAHIGESAKKGDANAGNRMD